MSLPEKALDKALNECHALVTGASRGIGRSIATALSEQGVRVSLLGRDGRALAEAAAQLGGASRALPLVADVTDSAAVAGAFGQAREHFGAVDILINNAGQAASARFTDTDEELWNRVMSVNLHGTYLCTRQVVPDMLQRSFGRIVNIASIAGLRGAGYISAYCASKHAVIGLTRSLAVELATRNITVNAVCPGYTDTAIVRDAVANIMQKTGRTEAQAREALLATNPQRRFITPEEVAHTVLWLCGSSARSITGQSIVLAGGEVT